MEFRDEEEGERSRRKREARWVWRRRGCSKGGRRREKVRDTVGERERKTDGERRRKKRYWKETERKNGKEEDGKERARRGKTEILEKWREIWNGIVAERG